MLENIMCLHSLASRFPHIYWTKKNPMNNTTDRVNKLLEEVNEVKNANNKDELLDEVIDVLHCCFEIIRVMPADKVDKAIEKHNAKNRKRGYYQPKHDAYVFDELELYK